MMSETSSNTAPSLRLAGVGAVAFGSIAWWPAFTLGAWGTVFFPQLLSLWAVATAAFVLVIVSGAVRRRVGWWALALLKVTPDPATSTVEVVAKADLAIVKTHQGGPWTIGRQGTWNVKVTNNGPSDNPGPIRVTDNLPKGNEYVSGTGDGWTCTASGRTVVCELPAGLLVGQSAQISIRVNVVSGAFPEVVNPAEVTSPIEDTDPSNDKATDSVRVDKEKQTADRLPPNPSVLPATNTKQGQKIRTKVRCRPLQSSAAGEASYCKVRKAKNGTIRVKVVGSRTVLVIVTQYAKGTKDYEPFKRVKKYRVKP